MVTATPVKNQSGEIIKVVSFTRDLTDILNLREQYNSIRFHQYIDVHKLGIQRTYC